MQEIVRFRTTAREQVVDITDLVRAVVAAHPEATLCSLFAQGATGAIMIQQMMMQQMMRPPAPAA